MRARHYLRFLLAFLCTAAAAMLAGWSVIFCGLYVVPVNRSAELVIYQKKKLRAAPPSEVILVGDSSLGNAINAQELSRLSGKNCLNLALNGAFGLEGSYEMIKWALDRHPVRKVIVMQTMDILTRKRHNEMLIYAIHGPASLLASNSGDDWENIEGLFEVFFSGRLLVDSIGALIGRPSSPPLDFADDYVRQTAPITLKDAEKDGLNGEVRKTQIDWFRRMKSLCESRGVDIIFVHGPIYGPAIAKKPTLVAEIDAATKKSGIPTDLFVQRMAVEEMGNSIDHVLPAKKDEFTRRYYDRLKDWLARPN